MYILPIGWYGSAYKTTDNQLVFVYNHPLILVHDYSSPNIFLLQICSKTIKLKLICNQVPYKISTWGYQYCMNALLKIRKTIW